MNFYRCINCGVTFKSPRSPDGPPPGCKACGVDPDTDPALVGYILPLETIHFDPPHPIVRFKGRGHLACNPAVRVAGKRATGEPSVVNCEACRATDVWKKAYGESGEPVLHEEAVERDKATIG